MKPGLMRKWMSGRVIELLSVMGVVAVTGAACIATGEWTQLGNPTEAGWSVERLQEAKRIAEEHGAAAVMVVEGGTAVAAWGAVDRPFPIHSMRKALYNAMVGMLVAEGKIDLDATLADLGITEVDGLTDGELAATVADVLASRSGVYHVSAYEPASMKRNRPERGSHEAGEFWFYNNWDFNLLAHLIERASGEPIEIYFRERLAEPLGMQDVSEETIFSFYEPSRSRYPAPIFRMSARDLARFGVLFEERGVWKGKRILAPSWIERSWEPHTSFAESEEWEDATGFGFIWWIHGARSGVERPFARHDIYLTRGSDGQVVAVVPALDLVIVHLTDTETGEGGSFEGAARVIDAVIAAKQPEKDEDRAAKPPLRVEPLAGVKPAPERRQAVVWNEEALGELPGKYELNPQISFLVHRVDDRLFALPQGLPLAEVELFRDPEGTVFSPVVDLELEMIREDGKVVALQGVMEGREVRIKRAE